eukprot:sb/3467352/
MLINHYLVTFFPAGVSKVCLNLYLVLQVYGTSYSLSFISQVYLVHYILFFNQSCSSEEKMKREISLLQAAGTELASLKTEHFKSQQQNQLLTQEIEKLNNVRVDMQSEDVALVTFRSMESRIAHLEHQNSVLQAQLESSTSSSSITDYREPRESPREAALSRELGEIKKGAGLLEKNFKAEIADLRSKIVRLSAEIEQKNEALSDKGEVIDALRVECQERRENERYQRVTIDQLRKRLADEAHTYTQILGTLQTSMDQHNKTVKETAELQLLTCPFCPVVLETNMGSEMEDHVHRKHMS